MAQARDLFKTRLLAASICLAAFSSSAHAAGFAIVEQSVTGLGGAFSAGSAGASDGSTIYFNPAGMSFLKDSKEVTLGAHVIDPNATFDDKGSYYGPAGSVAGAGLLGTDEGGDAGPVALVPNFYYTRPINEQWMFGLGVNAPFGLVSDYDDGWIGRYHALTSDLKTININPSVSYKVNPNLSIAGGISAQYIDALLSNAVDFGTIFAATMATSPLGNDGEAIIEGDDWAWGYNFGLMWQASPATRIGASYRSRVKYHITGEVDFRSSALVSSLIANPMVNPTGAFNDGDVSADVTLPDSLSVGFNHEVNDKLTVTGDITWTNWSVLDELRIKFDSGVDPDSVITTDWDDSNRYSLGMSYVYNKAWTWRAGIAFDESATQKAESLTPRVPDGDRTWLTVGFSYKPANSNLTIDAGYAHLFVDDAEVNRVNTSPTGEDYLRGGLVGEYELDVNILSVQARWAF